MISVQRTDITIYGNVFGGGSHFLEKKPDYMFTNAQTRRVWEHEAPEKTGNDSEAMFGLKYY